MTDLQVTDAMLDDIVVLSREAAADPSPSGMAHHEMHARLHPLTVLALAAEVRVLREALEVALETIAWLHEEDPYYCLGRWNELEVLSGTDVVEFFRNRAYAQARARLAAQEVDRGNADMR